MKAIRLSWEQITGCFTPARISGFRRQRQPVQLEPLEVRTLLSGRPFDSELTPPTNHAPVVVPVQFLIGENSVNKAFIGPVLAVDADPGQTKIFSLTSGNTNDAFAINVATGVLTVKNSTALDFETQPRFDLKVRVDDNGVPALFNTATVTVFLRDENDAPRLPNIGFLIGENSINQAFIGTVFSSDQDAGQTRTYSFVAGNDDEAFAIDPITGVLTVNNSAALDFETRTHFNLTVRLADDGSPAQAGFGIVTVFLRDENDTPVVFPTEFLIGENSVNNAFIGVVPSTDADAAEPVSLMHLSIAQQTSELALSGALLPTGVLGNRGTVLTSEALRDIGNALAPITPTTLLTQVCNSSSTTALFATGQTVQYTPKKGGRTIDAVDLIVTATTTVQDLLTYLNDSLAIQTQADDPTIPADAGTNDSPGVTLMAGGSIQIVGNGGRLNDIDTTVGDLTADGHSVWISFAKTQDAIGEGAGTDFVIHDSLGRPINLRLTTNLESRDAGTVTHRWYIESVEEAGRDVAIATGTFEFDSQGIVFRGEKATFYIDHSQTGASRSMPLTIVFSQLSGISTASAGSRLNLSGNDGTAGGIAWYEPIPSNGQSRTYALVAGNTDNAFAINPNTGVLRVNNSAALDYEARQRFDLTVRVVDDGQPAQAGYGIVTVYLRDEIETLSHESSSIDEDHVVVDVLPFVSSPAKKLLDRIRKTAG